MWEGGQRGTLAYDERMIADMFSHLDRCRVCVCVVCVVCVCFPGMFAAGKV